MIYLLFAFMLLIVELVWFRIADRFHIIDQPNLRSSHSRITRRGGGIVFYFAVLIYSLWFGFPYQWLWVGTSLIAGISLADDIRPVANRLRLLFHFTAILMLFAEWGIFQGFSWWLLLVALVFCVGIINAYNFMDGINGMTGGYSLVLLLTLIWLNEQHIRFADPALLNTVTLAVLVFNVFNFRKKALCFAGDVGSVSLAFLVLFFMGILIRETADPTYIIFLVVYGVDSVATIIHRLILRENIFQAHRKHAYQIMANELKVPHLTVAVVYMSLQFVVNGVFLLVSPAFRWHYALGAVLLLAMIYMLFINKFFYLHARVGQDLPS
ncbi:MraY family glycosyltransferase [Gaoshiqia sp. Z1-71]|uniref:MraY family glycosyltransferase n=1 Tax=Gaoshiqia hydrogeniformans TaxID=3290090 RepID=UPI003BF83464